MPRMTITWNDALERDIQSILNNPDSHCYIKSEILRNAVVMYKMILDEIGKGNKLTIANSKDEIIKEIMVKRCLC